MFVLVQLKEVTKMVTEISTRFLDKFILRVVFYIFFFFFGQASTYTSQSSPALQTHRMSTFLLKILICHPGIRMNDVLDFKFYNSSESMTDV